MRPLSTRVLFLGLGAVGAGAFVVGVATGHKPDDGLLTFAGTMFAAYAVTARDDDDAGDNHDDDPEPKSRKRRRE